MCSRQHSTCISQAKRSIILPIIHQIACPRSHRLRDTTVPSHTHTALMTGASRLGPKQLPHLLRAQGGCCLCHPDRLRRATAATQSNQQLVCYSNSIIRCLQCPSRGALHAGQGPPAVQPAQAVPAALQRSPAPLLEAQPGAACGPASTCYSSATQFSRQQWPLAAQQMLSLQRSFYWREADNHLKDDPGGF